jgi:predicted phage terminase large subunit-like protein
VGDQIVQSWDCAVKPGAGNDWSVCVTAAVRKTEVFILDVYRARLDFPKLRRAVEELAARWNAGVLLIEDSASGAQLIQQLQHEQPRGVPRPIACKPDKNKEIRFGACTPFIESGGLLLPAQAP